MTLPIGPRDADNIVNAATAYEFHGFRPEVGIGHEVDERIHHAAGLGEHRGKSWRGEF